MRLEFVTAHEWSRLAWLAVCQRSTRVVTCVIGPGVETADDWFFEGIWAGPFGDGDTDETDLTFGSGGRVRDEQLMFVSAGTTLDAIYFLVRADAVLVSNSLPCLLAVAGGSLDVGYPGYHRAFASVRNGLEQYQRTLPTTVGHVHVTYFDNLVWNGAQLTPIEKPCASRDFSSYAKYRAFLDSSMAALVANAQALEREHPFGLMSTLSRGYDSPTVTVLARQAGCREAFGFDRSPDDRHDSGEDIAQMLGVRFHAVTLSDAPDADVTFLAAGAGHGGSVSFKAAEPFLANRVVFTGFHGDKVWDKKTEALGPDIVRGDTSGSDLREYRLRVGFVNCVVPFLGVRQIKSIHAISISPELAPWDVGGRYSRPICRRIVEECGVPREAFGVRKAGMFRPIPGPSNFLTPDRCPDYFRWLETQRWNVLRRGRVPPTPWTDALITGRFGRLLNRVHHGRWGKRLGWRARRILAELGPDIEPTHGRRPIHRYVFNWAVECAKEGYPVPSDVPVP